MLLYFIVLCCIVYILLYFYEKDWSKFDRENVILDYFSVDWEDLFKIDELNNENSTQMYLDKINMLLDT